MSKRAFLRRLWVAWQADEIADVAAALTFYAATAFVPFLIFTVALTSRAIGPHTIDQLVLAMPAWSRPRS